MTAICVFCGSSPGRQTGYLQAAIRLGELFAERGIALVYGGGNIGMMGAVADSCMAAGGKVIGVIPRALMEKEHGHTGISRLEVVSTMHERKARMASLSDGFLALPGGIGTFEELFEVLTWSQLGIHCKPVGLVNVLGFFNPLVALLDQAVNEGFLRAQHRDLLLVSDSSEGAIDAMLASLGGEGSTDLVQI